MSEKAPALGLANWQNDYPPGDTLVMPGDPPAFESEAARLRRGLTEEVGNQTATLKATRRRIDKLLEEAKISAARREEIGRELSAFYRLLTDSAPYIMERVEEHTAEVVRVAKAEIAGFAEHVVRETGIKALADAVRVPEL